MHRSGTLPALSFRPDEHAVATQRRQDMVATLPSVYSRSTPLPYLGALRDLLPQPTSTQQERQRQQRTQLMQEWARQIEEKRVLEAQRRAQEALRDAQEDAAVAAYLAQQAAQRTPRQDTAPPLSAPTEAAVVERSPASLSQLQAQWALVQEAQQQLAAVGRRSESHGVVEPVEAELTSESRFLPRTSNRIPRAANGPVGGLAAPRKQWARKPCANPASQRWR